MDIEMQDLNDLRSSKNCLPPYKLVCMPPTGMVDTTTNIPITSYKKPMKPMNLRDSDGFKDFLKTVSKFKNVFFAINLGLNVVFLVILYVINYNIDNEYNKAKKTPPTSGSTTTVSCGNLSASDKFKGAVGILNTVTSMIIAFSIIGTMETYSNTITTNKVGSLVLNSLLPTLTLIQLIAAIDLQVVVSNKDYSGCKAKGYVWTLWVISLLMLIYQSVNLVAVVVVD